MKYTFSSLGDNAVRVQFGTIICQSVNAVIRKMALLLNKKQINGVTEWIPAYTTLTVFYNPLILNYKDICKRLKELYKQIETENLPNPREILIPTCYEGEFSPDLEYVAEHNKLSVEDVIKVHSQPSYLVYMLGFSPGFPYLGGMDKKIATPRLATPRQKVEAGSVGIAGEQTGIYSLTTPGGWQIIGKTPVKLFDIESEKPFLLQAGDILRFKPISEEEYYNIERTN